MGKGNPEICEVKACPNLNRCQQYSSDMTEHVTIFYYNKTDKGLATWYAGTKCQEEKHKARKERVKWVAPASYVVRQRHRRNL